MDDHGLVARLAPYVLWGLMKEFAAKRLAEAVDRGSSLHVEADEAGWEEFPTEMDILDRMELESKADVRPAR